MKNIQHLLVSSYLNVVICCFVYDAKSGIFWGGGVMWIYQQILAHNLNHSHSMLIFKDLEAQCVKFSSL